MSADGTLHIARPISLLLWIAYVQNWLDIPSNTKLVEDRLHGSETVRNLLEPFEAHGVVTFSYGIVFDTRDDRVSPVRGQYHSTRVDLSPGGTPGVPQRWGEWNTNLRWYLPIGTDGSVVALRAVGDLLFGFTRYDDTGALGGPSGIRGVPAQRYGGMIKVLGNIELRKMLFDFHFLSKTNRMGLAAFADTGRVFATYSAHPELDGTSLGLKVGVGGGVRVLAGKSFVLRADAAWSPDARPISFYVAAGQSY
jgi:outer membrane protein assembly factor BamA